jgi:UDP-N-acetylglucosamine 2-epimerase (non-hydrolysing)
VLQLKQEQFFLVSVHREENVDSPQHLQDFVELLNQLAKKYQIPLIVSTHPRTRKRMENLSLSIDPLVQFLKPFGFFDYVHLQMQARCVLSDSGTITEESSILNFPALNLREAHERPEGFEEAAVMMVGLSLDRVEQGLAILEKQTRGANRTLSLVKEYAPVNVSDKVLRIIQSYTDFINRKTWKRD